MKILERLDSKTLKDNTELLITMTIDETKNSAVLVLKLPSKYDKDSLRFKDLYYLVKYPKTRDIPSVNFDKKIEFSNLADSSKARITIDGK